MDFHYYIKKKRKIGFSDTAIQNLNGLLAKISTNLQIRLDLKISWLSKCLVSAVVWRLHPKKAIDMSTGNVSGIKWVDEASQSQSLLCFKKKKPSQASDRTPLVIWVNEIETSLKVISEKSFNSMLYW